MSLIRNKSISTTEKFTESDSSFSIAPLRSEETQDLLDTIKKLEERQKLCSKTYQFKEAAEAKAKIIELKKEVILTKCKEFERRHREEIGQIKEAQEHELQKFNEFWDERINEYQAEASKVEQQMVAKQEEDLDIMKKDLEESLNLKPVKTIKHLECINIIDSLAKNEEYMEAERFLKKREVLEKEELTKAKAEKDKKVKILMTQLEAKQKLEMNSLRQKISSGGERLAKMREEEFDKLQQKFRNMLQEIILAQQLEISKFETAYKAYIPGEKLSLSPNKRGGMRINTSEAVFASTNSSRANLDQSGIMSQTNRDKKKMYESKKSLTDTLCSTSSMSKDKQSTIKKHKRVISFQRT